MPHSSGGSSRSGGSHSSGGHSYSSHSSGHSSSYGGRSSSGSYNKSARHVREYRRISATPIRGEKRYVYYDKHRYYVCYSKNHPAEISKPKTKAEYIKKFLLYCLPAIMLIMVSLLLIFQPMKPITMANNHDIIIEDNYGYIEDTGKIESVFKEFQDETGITMSLVVVKQSDWAADMDTLEDYAYYKYTEMFDDERHWLIVYSTDNINWAFEGMQGNYTDSILTNKVTKDFNELFDKYLRKYDRTIDIDISEALVNTMNKLEISKFNFRTEFIVVAVFPLAWGIYLMCRFVDFCIEDKCARKYKNTYRVESDSQLIEDHCDYCGGTYVVGAVTGTCPYCGGALATHDETGKRVTVCTLDSE